MQRDPPPFFVYKGTSLTFVWKTGSIHLFNCFQNRALDAENLRHLLPMCCFHKPHRTLFMPPVSQQSTTNNNFSFLFSQCIPIACCFLADPLTNLLHLKLHSNMMDNVFPLRFQPATGGLGAYTPPSEFLFSICFIPMHPSVFEVKQSNLSTA